MFVRPHRGMSLEERWRESWMPITEIGYFLWIRTVDLDGYGTIRVDGIARKAHRYAWEKERGAIPHGWVVMHMCDITGCVNIRHLRLGTVQENNLDCIRKGRGNKPIGSASGRSKLSEDIVRNIISDPRMLTIIAQEYGVTASVICRIKQKKAWRHVVA